MSKRKETARKMKRGATVAFVLGIVLFCRLTPVRAQADPWPMFRHDAARTGRSDYAGPRSVSLEWSWVADVDVRSSPAVGGDGRLYVATRCSGVDGLFALGSDGISLWDYAVYVTPDASPALSPDGRVYLGSGDRRIYAINSTGDPWTGGTLSWSYTVGDGVYSSAAAGSDGRLYVGSWDNRVYALASSGTLLWSYLTGDDVDSSPALGSEGQVYVGSWDARVYALTSSGSLLWSYATGDDVDSSTALGFDGSIYVGSWDNRVYAFTLSGSLSWSYMTGALVASSPAVGSYGTIYIGSYDNRLYAFDSGGSLSWSYVTGGNVYSSPAIGSDGAVYFGSYDYRVYAVDSAGSFLWAYTTGGAVISSPSIGSDGRIYAGSDDNNLYCLRESAPVVPLSLMKNEGGDYSLYGYEPPASGDWSYWDAAARNPSPLGRDLWIIPSGNDAFAMTEVDAVDGGEQELAVLKAVGGSDHCLYVYNVPFVGDWSYWNAASRNPSPLARDFWMITAGNDTVLLADGGSHIAAMKDQSGDYNLYLYDVPYPGDWSYWDAAARNPSALARDFWQIPGGNDAVAMCGLDTTDDGHADSILVVRNEYGDYNVYLWNMPVPGDWTYCDAVARNPSPRARDLWVIPHRNDIAQVAGVNRGAFPDELSVMEDGGGDNNFYIWNIPAPGDWTYWDAQARNPSPLSRDLWKIPEGNDTVGVAAPQ